MFFKDKKYFMAHFVKHRLKNDAFISVERSFSEKLSVARPGDK